jgi:tetratricopeptide (TPR) repeat protein
MILKFNLYRFTLLKGLSLSFLLILLPSLMANGYEIPSWIHTYWQNGQAKGLKDQLKVESRKQTTNPIYSYWLGKVYLSQGLSDSARLAFNDVKLKPDGGYLASIGLALLESLTGDSKKGQLELKRLYYDKDLKNSYEKCQLGYAFGRTGDLKSCDELISQACAVLTDQPSVFMYAGNVYAELDLHYKDGQLLGKACGKYEQVIYKDKQNIPARLAIAKAYTGGRNFSDARRLLQEVFSIDSTSLMGHKLMGELCYLTGNYTEASKNYTYYADRSKLDPSEMEKFVNILWFNKEYAKANKIIKQLLAMGSKSEVLLRLYAYTCAETKQGSEGLEAIRSFFNRRTVIDSSRLIASDFDYYGRLLAATGKDSLAIIQYKKSLSLDSTQFNIYEQIAKSAEKMKDFVQAVEAYNRLIKSKPNTPSSIFFQKGRNLMLLIDIATVKADTALTNGYLREAANSFEKVIELTPNSHLGYQWKGRALSALDPETTKGLAKECYLKAVSMLEAKNQPDKYRQDLIEGYRYLGYLNYLLYDKSKAEKNQDQMTTYKTEATVWWQKVLTLDPENTIAKQALTALK